MSDKTSIHGWIFINKPIGLSSNQLLSRIKRILGLKKAGHTGTLDPLASGVMLVALGEATKTIPLLENDDKTYVFSVRWGEKRTTGDAEGEVIETSSYRPSLSDIQEKIPEFTGQITQIPPAYSAIKINGQRAYQLARSGQHVDIPSRQVYVHDLVCLNANNDEATFQVRCSKGTYVRSLAIDLADVLGTVGYVSFLERTSVGYFNTADTITLDKLSELGHSAVRPLQVVLNGILALNLVEEALVKVQHGHAVSALYHVDQEESIVAAFYNKNPVGMGIFQGGYFVPKRIFNII